MNLSFWGSLLFPVSCALIYRFLPKVSAFYYDELILSDVYRSRYLIINAFLIMHFIYFLGGIFIINKPSIFSEEAIASIYYLTYAFAGLFFSVYASWLYSNKRADYFITIFAYYAFIELTITIVDYFAGYKQNNLFVYEVVDTYKMFSVLVIVPMFFGEHIYVKFENKIYLSGERND